MLTPVISKTEMTERQEGKKNQTQQHVQVPGFSFLIEENNLFDYNFLGSEISAGNLYPNANAAKANAAAPFGNVGGGFVALCPDAQGYLIPVYFARMLRSPKPGWFLHPSACASVASRSSRS